MRLVKLIPTGSGQPRLLSLNNWRLVLDASGFLMYEEDGTGISRLKRIQTAATNAIQKLKPTDKLAIVAFAHNAEVVLPSTRRSSEKARIEEIIEKVDLFNVDPGGTAMDEGHLRSAWPRSRSNLGNCPEPLSQVLVLTDGETSGEQECRQPCCATGRTKRRSSSPSWASARNGIQSLDQGSRQACR